MAPSVTSDSKQHAKGVETLRESALTGIAIVVPLLVTLYVIELALGFVLRGIAPWIRLVLSVWPAIEPTPVLVDTLALGTLAVVTLAIGFVVHFHAGEVVVRTVDDALERVPGVGTLYGSVRRMADTMLIGDDHSFQAVKLVEMPVADHHMLGFVTTPSPDVMGESAPPDVKTVFVPLAPNPVMAGFVIHVGADQLRDVDMTVEEGISAIVSLGSSEGSRSRTAVSAYDMSG